jgi:SAM-dependent methyltransferase
MASNPTTLMGYAVVAFGLLVLIPQLMPNEARSSRRAPAPLLEEQLDGRVQTTGAVVDVPVPSTMDGVAQPRRKAFAQLAAEITESNDTSAPTPAPPTAAPMGAACSPHVTGLYDCKSKELRQYFVPDCQRWYTIPQMYNDFAAHQVEWNMMGKTQAFWSVLTGMPMDDSNVTLDMKRGFYASGHSHVREVIADVSREFSGWTLSGNVLDFGCGLGRLAAAFATLDDVRAVACVDQSTYHLEKATDEVEGLRVELGLKGRFRTLVSNPDLLGSIRGAPKLPQCYDLVHSVIVLQHMVPPLQVMYMEQMCDALAPGGKLWLQIPYKSKFSLACDEESFHKLRLQGGMQMHAMSLKHAGRILERRGCSVKVIDVQNNFVDSANGTTYRSMVIVGEKRRDYHPMCGDQIFSPA